MIERQKILGSTAIREAKYDTKKHELSLDMTDGTTQVYSSVPRSEFHNLVNSSSAGAYFNKNIRNSYQRV